MIAAVDVHYLEDKNARAALVMFEYWRASTPDCEDTAIIEQVEPYVPGQFYCRELPCIKKVIEPHLKQIEVLIVDGYVWLDAVHRPGLGAHLHETVKTEYDRDLPIIGVAKTSFAGAKHAQAVLRNRSGKPLYVTSVGFEQGHAAEKIQLMHGSFRLPTLLKRVDAIARGIARESP